MLELDLWPEVGQTVCDPLVIEWHEGTFCEVSVRFVAKALGARAERGWAWQGRVAEGVRGCVAGAAEALQLVLAGRGGSARESSYCRAQKRRALEARHRAHAPLLAPAARLGRLAPPFPLGRREEGLNATTCEGAGAGK